MFSVESFGDVWAAVFSHTWFFILLSWALVRFVISLSTVGIFNVSRISSFLTSHGAFKIDRNIPYRRFSTFYIFDLGRRASNLQSVSSDRFDYGIVDLWFLVSVQFRTPECIHYIYFLVIFICFIFPWIWFF